MVSDDRVIYGAARDITERRRQPTRTCACSLISRRRCGEWRHWLPGALPRRRCFSAVAAELARCLGIPHSCLFRYEHDGTGVLLAAGEDPGWMKVPIGTPGFV